LVALPPAMDSHVLHRAWPRISLLHRAVLGSRMSARPNVGASPGRLVSRHVRPSLVALSEAFL